jgi:hypothetical protein
MTMTGVNGKVSGKFAGFANDILRGGSIAADDVLRMRREVFENGVVDPDEVDLLFHLNDASDGNDPKWDAFFVEALTDFFVFKQKPKGYLGEEDGRWLVDHITRDGKIDRKAEFDLLVNILYKANAAPESVILLALQAIRESVLEGSGVLFGEDRGRSGVIDARDVEAFKKILYGTGSGSGFTISRREAELLFELNNATVEKENHPSWKDLFVKGVGNYLMFPRGRQRTATADEALDREKWLDDKSSPGVFGKTMKSLFTDPAAGIRAMRQQKEAVEERKRAVAAEAEIREAVTGDEAAWLIAQITRDDIIHENEKALLAFIKQTATTIHSSLDPYIAKYGV